MHGQHQLPLCAKQDMCLTNVRCSSDIILYIYANVSYAYRTALKFGPALLRLLFTLFCEM